MSVATEKLERQIRKLPLRDMVTLHERLISSIHRADGELGLAEEWKAELRRRIDDIDAGGVKGIPVDLTYRKLRRKHS